MKDYFNYLEAAQEMARLAGEVHLSYFRTDRLDLHTKLNVSDVVTAADKEAERVILSYIHDHFPGHGIIAEESGSECEDAEWRWIIDPLDGTTNFSQGLPVFSVSIALQHNKETVVGVVFAPYLREMFHAVKDCGAFLNGKEIHCSDKKSIAESVVATGIPYDKRENPDNNVAEVTRVAVNVRGLRRLGSAAIDLSYVAAGFLDAYWELNLKHWDVAAGSLIASEAGASLVPIRENRNHSILCATPGVFRQMLELLLTPDIKPSH
jgi:myo-inositol-1(or 4)-monophosphatase